MPVSLDQLKRTTDGVVVDHFVWLHDDSFTGLLVGEAKFVNGASVGLVSGRAVRRLVAGAGNRVRAVSTMEALSPVKDFVKPSLSTEAFDAAIAPRKKPRK